MVHASPQIEAWTCWPCLCTAAMLIAAFLSGLSCSVLHDAGKKLATDGGRWLCRQNGCLEIMHAAAEVPGLQDMIIATLIGMLEWRKHNNSEPLLASQLS